MKIFPLPLFLTLLLPLGSFHEFVIYANQDNQISIPSKLFQNQEPFSIELSNTGDPKSLNSVCLSEKIDLNFQELASYTHNETYFRNPEFVMNDDILYLVDLSQQLKVFLIDETRDELIELVSQQNIGEKINSNSFLRIFQNPTKNEAYLVIDNALLVFSTEKIEKPTKKRSFEFEEKPGGKIIQAAHRDDCFFLMMDDRKTINEHCLNNESTKLTKNFILDSSFFEFSFGSQDLELKDLLIDGNVLLLSEKFHGFCGFNVTDKNDISLLFYDNQTNLNKISLFESTLFIVRSFTTEINQETIYTHYLEEYVTDTSNGYHKYTLNRNISLSSVSEINSVHISPKFVLILQENLIKIYRHSIPSNIMSNDEDFLKNILARDVLALERGPVIGTNDLILAIFGSKITVYKFLELNPTILCHPNSTFAEDQEYKLGFFVLTKGCKDVQERISINEEFSYCNHSNNIDVLVSRKTKGELSKSIMVGIIAALVIFGVFGLCLIGFFVYHYRGLNKKYKFLEQSYLTLKKFEEQGVVSHEEIQIDKKAQQEKIEIEASSDRKNINIEEKN